jgi:hypothetical protein
MSKLVMWPLTASRLQTLQTLSTQSSTLKAPSNGTQSDFQLNQISVISTEHKAIAVRERSQRLADELNSPSAMGLAIVAQSQVAAMIDVQSLKGGGDAEIKMLQSLVERVKNAMTQNEENLRVVNKGCRK